MSQEFAFWHYPHEDTGGAQINGQFPLYDRGHIAEVPDAATRSRWAASSKASLILLFDPDNAGPLTGVTSLNGGPLAGFRNLLVNGCHRIWQRGTSIAAQSGYTADRHVISRSGTGSVTISRQTLLGTEGIGGNPQYALRWDPTALSAAAFYRPTWKMGGDPLYLTAGRRCIFSFWAKSTVAVTMAANIARRYGSGGSSSDFLGFGSVSLTTSWQRFEVVMDLPSLSGKTIGAGHSLEVYLNRTGSSFAEVVDFANVQFEIVASGQTAASPFEYRDKDVEEAMCLRYFERITGGAASVPFANGYFESATSFQPSLFFARKRAAPTISFSPAGNFEVRHQGLTATVSAISAPAISPDAARLSVTTSGGPSSGPGMLRDAAAGAAIIDISAEL